MLDMTIWLAMIVQCAAQLADYVTTEKVLKAGKRETNPLVRKARCLMGPLWILPKMAAAVLLAALGLALYHSPAPALGLILQYGAAAWFFALAAHNRQVAAGKPGFLAGVLAKLYERR